MFFFFCMFQSRFTNIDEKDIVINQLEGQKLYIESLYDNSVLNFKI